MKRILFTALLLAMLAGGAGAQTAENPKRTVLFTLGANEVIHYSEYLMCLSPNGYKFAAIIENKQTHEFTFVFNGKRIAKGDGMDNEGNHHYWSPFDVFYLNPEKDDGYGYGLEVAGRYFTWLGNRLFPDVTGRVWDFSIRSNSRFAFRYEENDRWHANIDGKIFGPYGYVGDVAITGNGRFAFSYKENDKWYANIDGKSFGPYGNIGDVAITDNGRFAFSYSDNDHYKWYVNIDGKIFGTYGYVGDVAITDNGKFACAYRENDKWNYNVNGEKVSEYDYRIALAEITGKEPSFDFNNSIYLGNRSEIELSDGRHIFYSNPEYDYAVIDGRKVGKSPAIHAYHDKKKNAFVWNAIEGKELVVYEYKPD
jgi:hypothetical protein